MRNWSIVVLFGIALFLAGCREQAPGRTFIALDLLLPVDSMPAGWEMIGRPRPMGAVDGFGDEDDAVLSFKSGPTENILADHFVLRFSNAHQASVWYQKHLPGWFNSESLAVSKPWTTPSTWSFSSSLAAEQHAACTINNVVYEKEVCKYMAQYEEFVVIFWSVIRPDLMTVEQFENTVAAIDAIMVLHLEE